ncbi:MAG: carboxymuconolactone decarboxylase family protein [Pseudomonadota bacterium]
MPASLDLDPIFSGDWPPEISDMEQGFAGALNVYRTMAHHPALLRAWSDLRAHIVTRSALGPALLEVVILRTGFRLGSEYEWSHHVLRGREAGLSDARIAALRGDPGEMDDADACLARAVDELFDGSQLSDATSREVVDLVGRPGLLDLMATVGFYSTLGFILNTAQTPLDAAAARALDAAPLADTTTS